jgi:hypothetical protein
MKTQMKHHNFLALLSRVGITALFALSLTACGGGGSDDDDGDGGEDTIDSVDEIVVPANFEYKTDKTVTLNISVTDALGSGYDEVAISVYDGVDDLDVPAESGSDLESEDASGDTQASGVTDDHLLLEGMTDGAGAYYVEGFKIPAHLETLYVSASAMGFNAVKEVDVSSIANGGSVNVTLSAAE